MFKITKSLCILEDILVNLDDDLGMNMAALEILLVIALKNVWQLWTELNTESLFLLV